MLKLPAEEFTWSRGEDEEYWVYEMHDRIELAEDYEELREALTGLLDYSDEYEEKCSKGMWDIITGKREASDEERKAVELYHRWYEMAEGNQKWSYISDMLREAGEVIYLKCRVVEGETFEIMISDYNKECKVEAKGDIMRVRGRALICYTSIRDRRVYVCEKKNFEVEENVDTSSKIREEDSLKAGKCYAIRRDGGESSIKFPGLENIMKGLICYTGEVKEMYAKSLWKSGGHDMDYLISQVREIMHDRTLAEEANS